MAENTDFFTCNSKGGISLRLHIQPRSAKDQIAGTFGDALKIRITAPPVEGRANEHLRRFLAKTLDVRLAQLSLSGEQSREKTVHISDLSPLDRERILNWCRRQSDRTEQIKKGKTGN